MSPLDEYLDAMAEEKNRTGRGGRRKGAGRPPLDPQDRRDPFPLRLSAEHVAALEALCREGETPADVIRRLIDESVERD